MQNTLAAVAFHANSSPRLVDNICTENRGAPGGKDASEEGSPF